MTMEHESGAGGRLVRGTLPWIVAVIALVVYLLTLNHWVSLLNLSQVASAAGWKGQSEFLEPVYYLVMLPLRWLPAKWIPLSLNLFSAACAALTLAQLARSVALLPHDRTHEQRERERSEFSLLSIPLAWVPPVMAVLVCGLQLTFWEHGTNGTSEMLDLLMFAYVIRCLLEYRVDERESRLLRAAFVCGAGITNNFALIGFFPAFLAALLWLRGLSFFNSRFLGRMMLCGLAGLSLYLLLPLIASWSQTQPIGFLEGLKFNLLFQKNILVHFPRKTLLLMSLISLVPVLLATIRWGSYFGDTSYLGMTMAKVMFHVVHAAFFLICLWVTLDPPFSPRNIDLGNPALKLFCPFLPFYYLGALSVGYFSGYFLLAFRVLQTRFRRPPPLARPLNQAVTIIVLVLLILVPAGLLYRNLPQIRATNGPILRRFADALAQGLPKNGVLLSDDLRRLVIIQMWLAEAGREKDYIVVHTESLKWPAYHRYLHKRYPQKWPAPAAPKRAEPVVEDTQLVAQVQKLAKDSEILYLHSSFGYYFEFFFDEPHGLTHKLIAYPGDSLLPPPLTPLLILENEEFWARTINESLNPILAITARPPPEARPTFVERLFQRMHLPREQNVLATTIGSFYSHALDTWGVGLQRANEFEKAAARFELAQQLNPDNVVAEINLQYNKEFRAGRKGAVQLAKSVEDSFGKYRSWEQVMTENGPYDEPSLAYAQGYVFLQGRLYRQAAQSFDRVRALSPEDLASRLWLAQLHLMANLPDKALAITTAIRATPELAGAARTNLSDLVSLEATAYFAKKEPEKASQLMEQALERNPTNAVLFANVARLYADHGMYTEAQATLDRQLKLAPNDPSTLINKSVVYVQANDYDAAIRTLNRVLTQFPGNQLALFYRAVASLRSDKLDDARKDYEVLQRQFTNSFQIYFGLGEIAYRQKNTNAAIGYYQAYRTNAPPNSAEGAFVSKRLQELKGENPMGNEPQGQAPKAGKP